MTQKSGQVVISDSIATQFSNVAIITVMVKAHPNNSGIVWIGNDGADSVSATTGFPLSVGDMVIINLDGNLKELFGLAAVDNDRICWIIVD